MIGAATSCTTEFVLAQPLQPDRSRKPAANLERKLVQARGRVIDIARIDVVADLEERGEHGEHDRAGFDHARRRIVGPPA
jgi:hypothetical protein